MKRLLAIIIASVMVLSLAANVSARYSLDRLFVNENDRLAGEAAGQSSMSPRDDVVRIEPGDKIFILGWAVSDNGACLDKIVYTIDGGENIDCTGGYRDRPDVAAAFGLPSYAGEGAGFGFDDAESGGMMELTGIDELPEGRYEIAIKAVFDDGSEEVFNGNMNGKGVFTLLVGDAPDDPVETDDPGQHTEVLPIESTANSGTFNIDRMYINHNVLDYGEDVRRYDPICINEGDRIYLLGWAYGESNLKEIVYVIDNGSDIACSDNYRDRYDVAQVMGLPSYLGEHAGFGHDTIEEGGMLELLGINELTAGSYMLTLKAVYNDGTYHARSFNLAVGEYEVPETYDPDTDIPDTDAPDTEPGWVDPNEPELTEGYGNINFDAIYANTYVMGQGSDLKNNEDLRIDPGDNLYILGWAYGEYSNLREIVYSIDGGENIHCSDNYRDRPDVAWAFGLDQSFGLNAGFGNDSNMFRLNGINELEEGTYELAIKAVFNDDTYTARYFTLVVGEGGGGTVIIQPTGDGQWHWISGEPFEYTHWGSGEPNGGDGEPRMAIWPSYWNDLCIDSYEQGGYICEWNDEESGSYAYNGHSYSIYHGHYSWDAAEAKCEQNGGYLACITSREEQAFIESIKDPYDELWIGGYYGGGNPDDTMPYIEENWSQLNIDRIYVNNNTLYSGNDVQDDDPIRINEGDKIYILGWAISDAGLLREIVYSVDGGEDISCPDNYRDRPDVAGAFGFDPYLGTHAGFGHDDAEEGGMLELSGIDTLTNGVYSITIKAVFDNGSFFERYYTVQVGEDQPYYPPEEEGYGNLNIDRIYINANDLDSGIDVKDDYPICINEGDRLYILGWAFGEYSNLREIVYSIDGGADISCPDNYRDRSDVAAVLGLPYYFGDHAGFGHDSADEGGLLELSGINTLTSGIYQLKIKAIFNDDTFCSKSYSLAVGGGETTETDTDAPETEPEEEEPYEHELQELDPGMLNIVIDGGTSQVKARPGDEIDVRIELKNNYSISSLKIMLKHDKYLSVVTDSKGKPKVTFDIYDSDDDSAMRGTVLDAANNWIILNWMTADGEVMGDTVYATVTFKVSEDAPIGRFLPIKGDINPDNVFDINQRNIEFNLINGGVDVFDHEPGEIEYDNEYHWHRCLICGEILDKEAHIDSDNDGVCDVCGYVYKIKGDINGDGEINNKDIVVLFRYISGNSTGADMFVYDFNSDGELNNKDVVSLFRFVSTST